MATIQRTGDLRSAFLKIGWAPLVTICGIIILCIIAVMTALSTGSSFEDSLTTIKVIIIGGTLLSLTGYFLTYLGFSQASKALGTTPAGSAFSTIRVIFLIYTISNAISFILVMLLPDAMESYLRYSADAAESMPAIRLTGGLIIAYSIIMAIFSIVALFIVRSKMKTAANTTNIKSLRSAYTGANLAVYAFFASFLSGFVGGFSGSSSHDSTIVLILELATFALAIIALVKWIGGWLGAASEVMHHEVEAEDYNRQYN